MISTFIIWPTKFLLGAFLLADWTLTTIKSWTSSNENSIMILISSASWKMSEFLRLSSSISEIYNSLEIFLFLLFLRCRFVSLDPRISLFCVVLIDFWISLTFSGESVRMQYFPFFRWICVAKGLISFGTGRTSDTSTSWLKSWQCRLRQHIMQSLRLQPPFAPTQDWRLNSREKKSDSWKISVPIPVTLNLWMMFCGVMDLVKALQNVLGRS